MPELPVAYRWLAGLSPLPRMIVEGLALFGTAERPGRADCPAILAWARELGLAKSYVADSVPWCGLFMAIVARRAAKPVPSGPLWAANWARFGNPSAEPGLGDVLVFSRPGGGGHVGLYVGEDDHAFHVLGGNQSGRVGFARLARARLRAARRPAYNAQPATVRPYRLAAAGSLSSDER